MIAPDGSVALTLFGEPRPTVVDLFAGAGGMTAGFRQAGFEPIYAVEIDRDAAETYRANFDPDGVLTDDPATRAHVYAGSIERIATFPTADVIIGGPPCQGFSPLGKNGTRESRSELNELWRQYLRAVRQVRPKVFVVENVPEFLKSDQFATFLEMFVEDPSLSDYRIRYDVLNAVDFGVPQQRRRGIVIGSRIGEPTWPAKTHGPGANLERSYVTVETALAGLSEQPTDSDLHWGRNPTSMSIERYRAVPPGGNRFDLARNRPDLLPNCWRNKATGTTDVFGRLWWDRPSVTIRTEFFKPEKGRYLHPVADRPITHREAARIQTFPDDFIFTGSRTQIARQIGNAVPPILAEAIAVAVRQMLAGEEASRLGRSRRTRRRPESPQPVSALTLRPRL